MACVLVSQVPELEVQGSALQIGIVLIRPEKNPIYRRNDFMLPARRRSVDAHPSVPLICDGPAYPVWGGRAEKSAGDRSILWRLLTTSVALPVPPFLMAFKTEHSFVPLVVTKGDLMLSSILVGFFVHLPVPPLDQLSHRSADRIRLLYCLQFVP
jgi:hypothetical protein